MKNLSKKIMFMTVLFVALFVGFNSVKMYDSTEKKIIKLDFPDEKYKYYDEEVGADVITFIIKDDGTVQYLTKEEVEKRHHPEINEASMPNISERGNYANRSQFDPDKF